jgi:hypothetical protein
MTSKVNIITTVSAWPEALEAQRYLINKYSKEACNFIGVIDTSPNPNPWNLWDPELRDRAKEIAHEYCDEVIMMPEELHSDRRKIFPTTNVSKAKFSNERASDVLQFIFEKRVMNANTPCLILDSDMFPIAPFSLMDSLVSKSIRGVIQHRSGSFKRQVKYYWNGLSMFEPTKLKYLEDFSFDCGKVRGLKVDTGGQSHWGIKKIEETGLQETLGYIKHLSSLNWSINEFRGSIPSRMKQFIMDDDRNQSKKIYSEIYDESFLHFRAGSNWREESVDVVRDRNRKFLESCFE